MIAASPAMTSMYAQPNYSQLQPYASQYAQAPAMTSMYAQAPASMYAAAPMTTTMAAPTTVAAPQYITQQAPSYVAAPQTVQTVAAPQVAFGMPQPVKLTQGMPEPALLEREKAAYNKALEAQLKKQTDAVLAESAIKKKMLEQQATTQRAEFELQLDERLKMSCLQVDQEANQQCNGLREAAITQQTALEEQAAIKTADYNKKKALEDFSFKSYEVQKQWFEKESAFTQQYQAVMKAGSKAVVTPALPQMPARAY